MLTSGTVSVPKPQMQSFRGVWTQGASCWEVRIPRLHRCLALPFGMPNRVENMSEMWAWRGRGSSVLFFFVCGLPASDVE